MMTLARVAVTGTVDRVCPQSAPQLRPNSCEPLDLMGAGFDTGL